ncbi:MAG: hypothetical protein K2W94_01980 [Alphaproteobacteria bacterium]|nr:hypothetical protein [Alphaproteobacteria bacterium]
MFKYIFIITFSIFVLFSKQSTFASALPEIPLEAAWETVHEIASSRSQYLKAVINVMKSDSPEDITYRENFRISPDLHERLTTDLENAYHLWALFERTLDNYKRPIDRSSMLETLLEETARVSHLADCDWVNRVMKVGKPIADDVVIHDLMPSACPLGKPIKVPVQKKEGSLQTYMIIPSMDILTQYGFEEHIKWRQMLAILKTQRIDYSPSIDTQNSLGKGRNGVDQFLRLLEDYHADKKTETYTTRKAILDQIKTMSSIDCLNTLKEILEKLVYPVHNLIFRLPVRSVALTGKESPPSLPAKEAEESEKPLEEDLSIAVSSPHEDESLKIVTPPVPSEVSPELFVSVGIPSEMLSSGTAAYHSLSSSKLEHVPGKLNPKGEREKAKAAALSAKAASGAAAAAVTVKSIFFLNAKHYKTLETILQVTTERQPPKWEAFKHMIEALGGFCDDSVGNGNTDFTVQGRSFTIHTSHTKGGRMYWTQVKNFAKSGLEHIGITLETVALRATGK